MITPMIFRIRDESYRVIQKKLYQDKLKQGFAYLLSKYNDYVYPYRGEVKNLDEALYVGLYTIDGHVFAVRPKTEEEKIMYSKERIFMLTPDSIFKNLNDMVIDPAIDEDIITDGDVFKPSLKQSDDLMLAGMKYAIGQKNINFNQYSHKFTDMATKNNGRRALVVGHSLKCDMASRFADVFDINYGIIFWDKTACRNPMDPDYNTIYCIYDDEPVDLTDPKYQFKTIERD